ncbi:hypothetical protein C8A01DRAFT_20963, partial [Parachaetomium inaequale]
MDCTPPELFEGQNLAYDASGNASVDIGGIEVPNPIWSTTFCDWFRLLVVHPFFKGSPALLAIVVQYAVKLRTNDRRRWPLENPTREGFLDDLAVGFRNPHPERSSRDLHSAVCRTFRQRGKELPVISSLFREMETSIRIAAVQSGAASAPFAPYMVATADIKGVVKALDDLHLGGVPAFL